MVARTVRHSIAFLAVLAFAGLAASTLFAGAISVTSGTITSGTNLLVAVSGTAPNGNTWASYVTGTNPVAYFDIDTGTLMFDPKGKNINAVDFRWGFNSTTISSTTPGPYVFATGTGQGAVSTSLIERTLPAGSWSAVTTFPARLSGNVTLTNTGSLNTSGGNIASDNGWFNQPWSFGAIAPTVTQSLMYSTTAGQGFRANTTTQNLLGYGNGIGMMLYIQNPSLGNQFGAVVPVTAVPEPSTMLLAGLGVAAAGLAGVRRRRQVSGSTAARSVV